MRADPASIAPERAIVFEVEGSVDDFYRQAKELGLEYLGDFEDEFAPDGAFYRTDDPTSTLTGRIYLAMPDVQALQQLLSRWDNYKRLDRMPKGQGDWGKLFAHLLDVRPWGPQDRVDDLSLRVWQDELAANPQAPIRLEAELWFYEAEARRNTAFQSVSQLVIEAGGQVLHHAVVPDIRYDAVLVSVPAAQVANLVANRNLSLARADEIMFLRTQTVASCPRATEFTGADGAAQPAAANTSQVPIVALLDGLPMQNHARLVGRLTVDDPDDLEPQYQVVQREHGTAMASLILYGDLNSNERALQRPLYVRPILRPSASGERSPENELFVDVVYRAVRRMKEGEGGQPPTAPHVVVINFSIGDEFRPFARMLSPLARLLDYLSYRYKVLFLVSAGNVVDRLRVPAYQTSQQFEDAHVEDREIAILEAMNASKAVRTLFSPAEAINVLTIGAAHSGSGFAGGFPANRFDPYTSSALPNVCSAMGLGFKKVVKPDLLMDGGRAPVSIAGSGGGAILLQPVRVGANLYGVKVAQPSPVGGLNYEDFTWGTSVAAALGTRATHLIYDVLTDAAGGSNHADVPPEMMPLLLKALLVHTARWGDKGDMLEQLFPPQGQGAYSARRDDITRLLGFGFPNVARVLDCAATQATIVGYGQIEADSGLLYRIPLPAELDGMRAFRAFTATLTWFSPLNMRHQGYRRAALDISSASGDAHWFTPTRDIQPSDKALLRGTVFHERRSAEQATVFVDDGHLLLRVSCRAAAGDLDEPVPFALAVTFEVGVDTGIEIYDSVRQAVEAQIAAAVQAE